MKIANFFLKKDFFSVILTFFRFFILSESTFFKIFGLFSAKILILNFQIVVLQHLINLNKLQK